MRIKTLLLAGATLPVVLSLQPAIARDGNAPFVLAQQDNNNNNNNNKNQNQNENRQQRERPNQGQNQGPNPGNQQRQERRDQNQGQREERRDQRQEQNQQRQEQRQEQRRDNVPREERREQRQEQRQQRQEQRQNQQQQQREERRNPQQPRQDSPQRQDTPRQDTPRQDNPRQDQQGRDQKQPPRDSRQPDQKPQDPRQPNQPSQNQPSQNQRPPDQRPQDPKQPQGNQGNQGNQGQQPQRPDANQGQNQNRPGAPDQNRPGIPPVQPGASGQQGQPNQPGQPNRVEDRARRLEDVRGERREFREGNRRVIQEGSRAIVQDGDRKFIRHDETDRFRRTGRDVSVQQLGNETRTYAVGPNGTRVVTVTDPNGRLLRRSRYVDGREVVIIDNRPRGGRAATAFFVALPAVALATLAIPRERYIVEAESAPPEYIYDALMAPPVEPLQRAYTLDEIRYSPELRDRMPRIDLDTITFDTGSWEIRPDQYNRLAPIADGIRRAVSQNPNEVFLIEGHTDAVGNDDDNLSLSDRRAEAVSVVLTDQFQIPPENLTTQGYGEQQLKVPTQGPERTNRRVTVRRITPLLQQNAEGAPQGGPGQPQMAPPPQRPIAPSQQQFAPR